MAEDSSLSSTTLGSSANDSKDKGESQMRAVWAKQNKELFEKIRNAALSNDKVLKKFQEYDAQSHKDKVAAAKTVADLRVSYFHYNSRAFQRYLSDIWDSLHPQDLTEPPAKRRKLEEDPASVSTTSASASSTTYPSASLYSLSSATASVDEAPSEKEIPLKVPYSYKAPLMDKAEGISALADVAIAERFTEDMNTASLAAFSTALLRTKLDHTRHHMKKLEAIERMLLTELERRPQVVCVLFFTRERVHYSVQIEKLKQEYPNVTFFDGSIEPFKNLKPVILLECLREFMSRGHSLKDLKPTFSDISRTMDLMSKSFVTQSPQIEIQQRDDIIVVMSDRPSLADHAAMKEFPHL